MAYVKGQAFIPQFEDANGNPLSGGSLEFYLTTTSTPTNVYKDSAGTVLGTSCTLNALGNPQDSGGTEVDIYFDDSITYKIVLKDSGGTQVDPVIDPFTAIDPSAGGTQSIQDSAATYGTDDGSTASAYAIDLSPTLTAYTAGQKFHFIAPMANNAAPTLNVDAVGAKTIVHPDGTALAANEMPANAIVQVIYDGTNFQLMDAIASATVPGRVELSTDAEADTGTDTTRAITPANLAYVLDGTGGTNQVETAAIADLAVTTAKIAANAVTDAKIVDDVAWRHIETVSWSSGATIASTHADIATMDELFIVMDEIDAGADELRARIYTGGTPTVQTSGYLGDASSGLLLEVLFESSDRYWGTIHIIGCEAGQNATMIQSGIHDNLGVYEVQSSTALYNGSTLQISGFDVFSSGGNFGGGRIVVYGRMNS